MEQVRQKAIQCCVKDVSKLQDGCGQKGVQDNNGAGSFFRGAVRYVKENAFLPRIELCWSSYRELRHWFK